LYKDIGKCGNGGNDYIGEAGTLKPVVTRDETTIRRRPKKRNKLDS